MEVKLGPPPSLSSFTDRRLLVVIGKGGVGKSTLAAALGLMLHRQGKRVLLAEVRTSRRLPSLLGHGVDTDGPTELRPGLHWINLNPQAALERYATMVLRFRSVYKAVFEQQAVRRFLRAVPSLAEILMLGHLIHLLEREGHELAVLDAPSTGPGALLLEAPRVVREAAPRGPLADGAAWIHGFLGDPARTGIALVSVPEELPVSEAIDLYQRFRAGFLPVAWLLANRTLPDPFPPLRPTCLDRLGTLPDGWPLAAAASTYRKRLALQERHLDRLRAAVDLPALPLPEVLEAGEPMAARLADAMGTALGQAREGRP